MSPELVGLIGFIVLFIFLFLEIPVAICMIIVGFGGLAVLNSMDQAASILTLWSVSTVRDYTMAILPIFLLMGEIADISGMMQSAFRTANSWLHNLPGGLAMASIFGAAIFSAISGSSTACAAIMTRVALPQLIKHKYDPTLATGALAAGGTLGNLIPPGILPVIYSIMTGASLGKLLIACLLPGALLTLMYLTQIYIQVKIDPSLAPRSSLKISLKEQLYSTKGILPVVIIFGLVMGTILFGICTPNESAAIGTVIVFIYALVRRTLNGQNIIQAFKGTLATTGMAFAILIAANIFSVFVVVSHIPQIVSSWILGMNLSPIGFVCAAMVVYFILGIPMNSLTMMLLTLPVFLPVLIAMDIDLVWFGVLLILQMELANLTPPIGMNLFVVAAMAKPYGISMNQVFKGSLFFCVTGFICNILLIIFPQISLFLVSLMK